MTEGILRGRVHSIQSMGTLDGPGVRFVVFLQGCPLRCACCHNPDTWECEGGTLYTADEIVAKAERFRAYFADKGGITLSGGEPLLQAAFARDVFALCKERGINTCLDTSGCVDPEAVKELLSLTDRVLLDVKYTDEALYRSHVGCEMRGVLRFLDYLNEKSIPTTLRQVIIPTLNDNEENMRALKEIADAHPCVDKVELLPFRKLCQVKYDRMGLEFPLSHLPEPTGEAMKSFNKKIHFDQ